MTTKGNKLYLQIFEWPEAGLTLSDLETTVSSARALGDNEKIKITTGQSNGTTILQISRPRELDPVATVIELQLAGPPKISESNLAVQGGLDGIYELKAGDAEIHGRTAKYDWEGVEQQDYIGSWTNSDGSSP